MLETQTNVSAVQTRAMYKRDCEDEESERLNMREEAISGVRPLNLGHDGTRS